MEEGSVEVTLKLKIPFFILGVILGQAVVWVSMQWVPMALVSAKAALTG
jgi:uncharacterized membrane protein YcfT